jgi:hypothetical protein
VVGHSLQVPQQPTAHALCSSPVIGQPHEVTEDIGLILEIVSREAQSVVAPARVILKRIEASLIDFGVNIASLRQFDLEGSLAFSLFGNCNIVALVCRVANRRHAASYKRASPIPA